MPFRYKILLFALVNLLCLPFWALAQQTIRGVVYKKDSYERVSQTLISDLNSKVLMMSDELGIFSIKASVGDTLLFTKHDFAEQKRIIISADDIAVYMQPVITLNQVTIQGQTKKQELSDVMKQYRSEGTFYNGHPPVSAFINSPISAFYELFGKTPKEARRFAAYSKDELETSEVNRRYTQILVKNTTKLSNEEVLKFMAEFTPSYEDIKKWNDYEIISYIKKSLIYYQANKGRDTIRMQKLY